MPNIIRKIKTNQYLLADQNVWVRDFTHSEAPAIDINSLTDPSEYPILLDNEIKNGRKKYPDIGTETVVRSNIVIVSDGYKFSDNHKLLETLPSDVAIIGTNKSLAEWSIKKPMTFYVVNNPYKEASAFLPKKTNYYPRCIASTRTNPKFLQDYRGITYNYMPCSDQKYAGLPRHYEFKIDDYRNPICAAIAISYRFRVQKLLLLGCDDSFDMERPGSIKLDNGLFCYPQQMLSSRIIDANVFWLKQAGIEVVNFSHGPKLDNAEYIKSEGITKFFGK